MRSYCCSIEWLTTALGRVCLEAPQWWQRCYFFLVLGFLVSFLSSLGDAPKIDLPLSMFLLAKTVLTSLFLELALLAAETNTQKHVKQNIA